MPTAGVNVSVATPLAFSVPVPSEVVPFKNVTVPVGVAPLVAVTVAVSVSDWPTVSEVAEAVRVVVVGMRGASGAAPTTRMRPLVLSAIYRFPLESIAAASGSRNSASIAGPPSPANPRSPLPAT